MKPRAIVRMWLEENRDRCLGRADGARGMYTKGELAKGAERLARCHEAAAALYQAELNALDAEEPDGK